jgi:hypothetical protein
MSPTLANLTKGTPVYCADGEHIGDVVRVEGAATAETMTDTRGATEGDFGTPSPEGVTGNYDLGAVPLGSMPSKGRGKDTISGMVAGRGDPHTTSGDVGLAPGSGGADALRGYGSHGHAEFQDLGDEAGTVDANSHDDMVQTGALGDSRVDAVDGPGNLRRTPGQQPAAVPASFSRDAGAVVIVEDKGVLGVGAGGLRVPVSEFQMGERGQLMLPYLRADARRRFGPGPSLDNDENAPHPMR